ncbi:phosphomannomutase/phosphoglucomutase [Sphingomonadaceae bacterium G21617-S1]|uniref:phosphoglucomutase/phosphomannomutase PgmG n=1 Tax=Rhizorhabdus sp. TaxID=1968843 RepID=UPI00121B9C04|nr:phosphomannomutase/phosphoglucomutase [Rhizorhabdus sp.]MBD3762640.1 phosphomannomutase/phosphoglucomutase [Rhizorhabdus sp.]MCZ4341741.1 phosphomannomutase/phosphoglucomutase [Sphingomonadaceae bacterium G21617-S1]TAK10830.1 MAG: phosphomannomutase/phosphoglucomutase [Rhizorhabdus sp.]
MTHIFNPTSLREYDIRGIVGKTLGPADAYAIGRGFATHVRREGGTRVAVGWDGRVSSESLRDELIRGLTASGVDVVRTGLGPTPMLYFAEATLEVDGGIQITGSHNPADYNGFKMVLHHKPFFADSIQSIGRMAAEGAWDDGAGTVSDADIEDLYVDRLVQDFKGGAFRIGWDNGNGAGGRILEKLVKRLPGEHHVLYAEIDGSFPHHHPDPTEEKNLADLKALVAEKQLDFGIAFDGDADRIGAIDGLGRVVWGDQILSILAEPVLRDVPGGTIIADVKASQALFDRVAELGGTPCMWKTGHSLIKVKMAETDSPLAGEMSGHIFFKHRWYGFDDALYSAVRLIEAVSELGGSMTALKDRMPKLVNTPELRFQVDESRKFKVVEEVLERLAASGADVDRTDGARVNTPDGWWLLRASNTQDVLVARAEAKDQPALDRLLAQIDEQLAASGLERGPQAGH